MKETRDYQRILHIITYCEKIEAVKNDVAQDYSKFIDKSNYQKVDVCAFYLGQIGELVHGLSSEFKSIHNDIPWKQIVDMRNVLVHRYGTRDTKIMWDTIKNDIPILNIKCREILNAKLPDAEVIIFSTLKQETNIVD